MSKLGFGQNNKRYGLMKVVFVLSFATLVGIALFAHFLRTSSSSISFTYQSIASLNRAAEKPADNIVASDSQDHQKEGSEHKNGSVEGRVLSATFADLPAPELEWEQMPSAPVPRLDGYSVQIKNLFYVFVGYRNLDHVHSHVDVYNFSDNTWCDRFDTPKDMANSHLGVATDGRYEMAPIASITGTKVCSCNSIMERQAACDGWQQGKSPHARTRVIHLNRQNVRILAISTVLAVVLWYTLRQVRESRYKTEKGLRAPEPSGALPIIGHLHLLGAEMTLARTFAAMADKYGPIFTIRLGKHPTVVVSNPEAMKECFTTHDRILSSRPRSSHGEYLSYNFAAFGFTNSGPFWREMRKIVSIQLLSSHRLKSLRHVQVSEVNTLINDLYLLCKKNKQGSGRIVISECFERLTINMITRMIAGKRYLRSTEAEKEEEGKRIGKLMKEYMYISGVFVPSDLIPFLGWMNHFPGPVKTMKRLSRELDSLMESWIQEHKLKRLESTTKNTNKMEGDDFIDVMLSLLDDSMFGYSRETIIKATAMTLIIAGADTTSITLTWIISNLLNHRRSLQLAQEELDLKVGRERWAEDSDIENLVYIQAIIKETLRLYPPGPLSAAHEATEDFCVAGYHIPKGTRLFANLWKLHRDPNLWSNPDEYMPERFLTDQANVEVLDYFRVLT
ncbi:hypothetical protein OIU85_001964 [Salix viminalis]|uniref:Cytochrome P450 n=1 Tax=Salix viminalis TaxID=40686 RepID=A0A9Q0ZYI7_SALVM|nr:hypothetical protein OIU85_001964 [Salix viminalis]